MSYEVRKVSWGDIEHLRKAAVVDRIHLANGPGEMHWWAAYGDGLLVGCAAVRIKNGRARVTMRWVHPDWRKHGIGDALTVERIAWCRGRVAVIDGYAFDPDYYVAKGFHKVGKPTAVGATKVVLVLAQRAKAIRLP